MVIGRYTYFVGYVVRASISSDGARWCSPRSRVGLVVAWCTLHDRYSCSYQRETFKTNHRTPVEMSSSRRALDLLFPTPKMPPTMKGARKGADLDADGGAKSISGPGYEPARASRFKAGAQRVASGEDVGVLPRGARVRSAAVSGRRRRRRGEGRRSRHV